MNKEDSRIGSIIVGADDVLFDLEDKAIDVQSWRIAYPLGFRNKQKVHQIDQPPTGERSSLIEGITNSSRTHSTILIRPSTVSQCLATRASASRVLASSMEVCAYPTSTVPLT